MEWVTFIVTVAAGLVLLFAGRRLFWLAVGLVVFLFTFPLINQAIDGDWIGLVVAALLGVVCAWLATKFIRIAGYVLGALAGAIGLPILLELLGINLNGQVVALIGAVAGFLLMWYFFDWGLVVLTVWAGANAVTDQVTKMWSLGAAIATAILVALMVAGIGVQAEDIRGKKKRKTTKK
jgi:hypothetical protein